MTCQHCGWETPEQSPERDALEAMKVDSKATQCIEEIIRREGGWKLSKVKHDRGGWTFAGISQRANPDWPGWTLAFEHKERRDSTPPPALVTMARVLYKQNYWDPLQLNALKVDDLQLEAFDCAVLSGPPNATRLLQAALGVKSDSVIGPTTLQAYADVSGNDARAVAALLKLKLYRIQRHCSIVRRNPNQRKFLLGWVSRDLGET